MNVPKPKYLVISRGDGNFSRVSPQKISREITKCARGSNKETRKTYNGDYFDTVTEDPRA